MVSERGIYVHVPFCSHACDFCAFYQVEPRRGDVERYLDCIAREFALVDAGGGCATVFWGGGTPGLLSARDLERLGRAQLERFGQPRREWTVELAPGSVRADKLAVLRELGVDRVSLGVQSFAPRLLEALGRRHSVAQIRKSWELIERAGFRSRNLDLIFAVPGQTIDDWRQDLDDAMALEPDHISTYCLTFEEDTALFVRLSQGKVTIDPDRERAFYEEAWDRLPQRGFVQYEISNHARPGHESAHNINTWRMGDWSGFGPSAASQESEWRASNPADLDRWEHEVGAGRRASENRSQLSSAQRVEDAIIFGLRMNAGVNLGSLSTRFPGLSFGPFRHVLDQLVRDRLARWEGVGQIALEREGRLLVDAIGAELVGTAAVASPA